MRKLAQNSEAIFLSCAESLSRVWLFVTPWIVARQAPLSIGILQTRILEWVAMPSSRGSSQPRDQTQVSRIAGVFFIIWATREVCMYVCVCVCMCVCIYIYTHTHYIYK